MLAITVVGFPAILANENFTTVATNGTSDFINRIKELEIISVVMADRNFRVTGGNFALNKGRDKARIFFSSAL